MNSYITCGIGLFIIFVRTVEKLDNASLFRRIKDLYGIGEKFTRQTLGRLRLIFVIGASIWCWFGGGSVMCGVVGCVL